MEFYPWAIRPLLFCWDPERTHRLTMAACDRLGRQAFFLNLLENRFAQPDPRLRIHVAGMDFPNPVGLAAGFDKNGEAARITARLDFGFVEVGSVSEQPSAGNAGRPRLWRLKADEALRVHYGCPSEGAVAVAARLRTQNIPVPLGLNLVETNTGMVTNAEAAAEELSTAIGHFAGIADYIALNLSCPNMPRGAGGLFDAPAQLTNLLTSCARQEKLPPMFLKITPPKDDNNPRFIDSVLDAVDPFPFVKGFILNIPNRNPYETLRTPRAELDTMRGGITGPCLLVPTLAAIAAWYARMNPARYALIGVGGIRTAEDAYAFIRQGASLVQLCTALIYRGPGLAARINRGLARLLERDGFRNVSDAVGVDCKSAQR